VPKREAFFRDALHFNRRGHALVARAVSDVIRSLPGGNARHAEAR
jgi:lysophospholipase L1-like esterase